MEYDTIYNLLENYRTFVSKIDRHIERLEKRHAGQIACKKGCDQCCTHLSLLPVEALSLALAFLESIPLKKKDILDHLQHGTDQCPLLVNNSCVLYAHRPVICRTHGYPVFMKTEKETQIDFCQKNFKGVTSFSKSDLLDIETLNTTLVAINQHFINSIDPEGELPERITMGDALFLFEKE